MKAYRKEGFFAYIKLHIQDVVINIVSHQKILISTFIFLLCFALFSESINSVFFTVIYSISIFVFGFIGMLYLFPMLVHYKNFKRSSEQFDAIRSLITKETYGCKIISSCEKVSDWERFKKYELMPESIDFHFDIADVFETKNSIFIFPIRTKLGKNSSIRITEYLSPIRFLRGNKEEIIGAYDVYPIFEFSEENKGGDKIFKFRDKVFKNEIKLRFKDYNNSNPISET